MKYHFTSLIIVTLSVLLGAGCSTTNQTQSAEQFLLHHYNEEVSAILSKKNARSNERDVLVAMVDKENIHTSMWGHLIIEESDSPSTAKWSVTLTDDKQISTAILNATSYVKAMTENGNEHEVVIETVKTGYLMSVQMDSINQSLNFQYKQSEIDDIDIFSYIGDVDASHRDSQPKVNHLHVYENIKDKNTPHFIHIENYTFMVLY